MKEQFDKLINSSPLVFVDFYAEWCGSCKMQAPILKEWAAEVGERVKIVKINVDTNNEIAARYQIQSIPTLMLFHHGQIVIKHSGVMSKQQLNDMIKQFK